MSDDLRGVIHNRARGKQIIDFSGLRHGNITPTDIDGSIEFHNEAWIFTEFKVTGFELPYGQQLYYERLVHDLAQSNKPAICIVANHDEPPEIDINAGTCLVNKYFYRDKWRIPLEPISVKDAIDKFYKIVEGI